jgi:hypothetical protein
MIFRFFVPYPPFVRHIFRLHSVFLADKRKAAGIFRLIVEGEVGIIDSGKVPCADYYELIGIRSSGEFVFDRNSFNRM